MINKFDIDTIVANIYDTGGTIEAAIDRLHINDFPDGIDEPIVIFNCNRIEDGQMGNTTDKFFNEKMKIIEIGKKLLSGVTQGEYDEIRKIELTKMLIDCPIDMQYAVLCLTHLIDELKQYLIKRGDKI